MPHKEDDISYLLSQISEGNSSCFEKMYKRYFKKCYSIALYFVQSTSSAEGCAVPTSFSLYGINVRT